MENNSCFVRFYDMWGHECLTFVTPEGNLRGFVKKDGEIVPITSIHPLRVDTSTPCTMQEVEEWLNS